MKIYSIEEFCEAICAGGFSTKLFYAIAHADLFNLKKLERCFPGHVEAFKIWSSSDSINFSSEEIELMREIYQKDF